MQTLLFDFRSDYRDMYRRCEQPITWVPVFHGDKHIFTSKIDPQGRFMISIPDNLATMIRLGDAYFLPVCQTLEEGAKHFSRSALRLLRIKVTERNHEY